MVCVVAHDVEAEEEEMWCHHRHIAELFKWDTLLHHLPLLVIREMSINKFGGNGQEEVVIKPMLNVAGHCKVTYDWSSGEPDVDKEPMAVNVDNIPGVVTRAGSPYRLPGLVICPLGLASDHPGRDATVPVWERLEVSKYIVNERGTDIDEMQLLSVKRLSRVFVGDCKISMQLLVNFTKHSSIWWGNLFMTVSITKYVINT